MNLVTDIDFSSNKSIVIKRKSVRQIPYSTVINVILRGVEMQQWNLALTALLLLPKMPF